MTNPHSIAPTGVDIRTTSDQIIDQLQQGQAADALRALERARGPERPVVQEAIDRYVAAGARNELETLRRGGIDHRPGEDNAALRRLERALEAPRLPDYSHEINAPNELVGLSEAQKYDVYASVVETRGSQEAYAALRQRGHSVLLGLRQENSAAASMGDARSAGTGIYDDHIVVLTRTADGVRGATIANRANTEPTAQYAHHAGSDGNRRFSGIGVDRETRRIEPSPEYEGVTRVRKIEGEDVNDDTMWDLGRLTEGTFEMQSARHRNPRAVGTDDAFRPSPEQMSSGRHIGLVQRDTNGDGYFTVADINGVQNLNESFKFHSGSRTNTDSAGCQTIHPDDYRAFNAAARANPQQTRWQYVLTSTQNGLFRNVVNGTEEAHAPREARPAEGARRQDDLQGSNQARPGPFNEPTMDRYYAAVLEGDSESADRIAQTFAQSLEGQRLSEQGERSLAEEREAQERQQSNQQQAPQAKEPPVMAM